MNQGTPKTQLSPELVEARKGLAELLKQTNPALAMSDRLDVIDRIIKIEALEYKKGAGRAGAAFDDDEEAA